MHYEGDEERFEFKAQHGSKPPLRWIANYLFEPVSMFFFDKAIRLHNKHEDLLEADASFIPSDFECKQMGFYFKMYDIFSKPYIKWGTVYVMKKQDDQWE